MGPAPDGDAPSPLVRWEGVTKSFGGAQALVDVSFGIAPGEVRGLCGENGSGKSTAIGVLSGEVVPDHGRVVVGGQTLRNGRIAERLGSGVSVAFQEPRLCPSLTVAENLFMGRLPRRRRVVSRRQTLERATRLLDDLHIPIDPRLTVAELSQDQRYLCEVARVAATDPQVIALDETTASLTLDAVTVLLDIVRRFAAKGAAVLLVSHRLEEIMTTCDTVTVLRDGAVVDTVPVGETTEDQLISMMVGRSMEAQFRRDPLPPGDRRLRVTGLRGGRIDEPVDLDVAAGEVLGIGGLAGSGRSTLLRLLYGAQRRVAGSVQVDGDAVPNDVRAAIGLGVGYVPEDRRSLGLALPQDVRANARVVQLGRRSLWGVADGRAETALVDLLFRDLSLKAPDVRAPVDTLSGGNQQKIVLGRWLEHPLRVLLLDEPTRGVDVRTKHEIYGLIHDLATRGAAIVMVSSDLVELIGVSDRIVVMREGRISASFGHGVTAEEIGDAMAATPQHRHLAELAEGG